MLLRAQRAMVDVRVRSGGLAPGKLGGRGVAAEEGGSLVESLRDKGGDGRGERWKIGSADELASKLAVHERLAVGGVVDRVSVLPDSCQLDTEGAGRTAATTKMKSTWRALTTRLDRGQFSPDSPPSRRRSCVSAESSYVSALMPRKGLGTAAMSICWLGCARAKVFLTRFHAVLSGCPETAHVGLLVLLRACSQRGRPSDSRLT